MALQQLTTALQSLSKSVSNFKIGAISIADLKPFEEQLADIRQILKVQRAHSWLLFAKQNSKSVTEKSQEDINATVSIWHEKAANLKISDMIIMLCYHSCFSEDIIYTDKPMPDVKKQVQGCMRKLFVLHDKLISLYTSVIEALKINMRLRIDVQKSLREYQLFLKEQEGIRDEKLQETNPTLVKNKKKMELKIAKINLMKRLMTTMIAASGNIMSEKLFLFEMLKKHRELLNIETIIEMGRDTESSHIPD